MYGMRQRTSSLCLLWACLLVIPACSSSKSVSSFVPSSQTLNMGVSITVYGSRLTSADMAMVALGSSTGGVACGSAQIQPIPLRGCEARRLVGLSSDGSSGIFRATPALLASGNVVCVRLFPSKTWQRVGSGSFEVSQPSITSISSRFGTGNAMSIAQFEPFMLTVVGTGIVQNLISLKISSSPCTSNNETNIKGGEPRIIEWSNTAGTEGNVPFTLYDRTSSSSSSSAIAICMTYDGRNYLPTAVTSASLVTRSATSFVYPGSFVPGVASTVTVTGKLLVCMCECVFVCVCVCMCFCDWSRVDCHCDR
jgi:hypothetical protein